MQGRGLLSTLQSSDEALTFALAPRPRPPSAGSPAAGPMPWPCRWWATGGTSVQGSVSARSSPPGDKEQTRTLLPRGHGIWPEAGRGRGGHRQGRSRRAPCGQGPPRSARTHLVFSVHLHRHTPGLLSFLCTYTCTRPYTTTGTNPACFSPPRAHIHAAHTREPRSSKSAHLHVHTHTHTRPLSSVFACIPCPWLCTHARAHPSLGPCVHTH